MGQALKIASEGLLKGEVPVGAIFVNTVDNKEMARSHNLTTQTKIATTHCEVNCIREISARGLASELATCCVYVTVEPCIMCAYALNLAGVKRVVFGAKNDKFGGNGSILSLHRFGEKAYEVQGGLLAGASIKLLQSFYEHGNLKLPENKRQRKT